MMIAASVERSFCLEIEKCKRLRDAVFFHNYPYPTFVLKKNGQQLTLFSHNRRL